MIELTLAQVATAVGGRLHRATGDELITGSVEFDTRRLAPGSLFVALPGERVDGHDYAETAILAGAAGVLAGRPVGAPAVIAPPVTRAPSGAYVLAGDRDGSGAAVLAALGRLARAVVDRLPALAVVGVTGSSGKTSTKDLIAALLAPLGPTVAPPGSFNNELGHPWTVLRADHDTRHLVLELSARGPGHVAALCQVAPPRIGVVLNVGSAHLGEFGSRAAIAAAKGELVEALPADGVAVLNADDDLVSAMAGRTAARVVTFGLGSGADVRADAVVLDASGRASFRLVTPGGAADVRLAVHGEHQVGNALAAAAVALELGGVEQGGVEQGGVEQGGVEQGGVEQGGVVEQVAAGLAAAAPVSRWRMEVAESSTGVTVINDAYNANPESVRAALRTLVAMTGGSPHGTAGSPCLGGTQDPAGTQDLAGRQSPRTGGATRRRSWAVLGPIGELGGESERAHRELGRLVAGIGVDRLVVVGADARALHDGARDAMASGEESVFVPDVEAAVALLLGQLRADDVVLVKASRAYGLERIAAALLAGEQAATGGERR